MGQPTRLWRSLCALPSSLWLVSASSLLFFASWSMVYPFLGVYMVRQLHASIGTVGLILGSAYFAAIPLQIAGGRWADRRGRKSLMLAALAISTLLFTGLAFSRWLWLTTVLAIAQGASGWPLFLVASNAMVADLTTEGQRPEAFGLVRIALNAGRPWDRRRPAWPSPGRLRLRASSPPPPACVRL